MDTRSVHVPRSRRRFVRFDSRTRVRGNNQTESLTAAPLEQTWDVSVSSRRFPGFKTSSAVSGSSTARCPPVLRYPPGRPHRYAMMSGSDGGFAGKTSGRHRWKIPPCRRLDWARIPERLLLYDRCRGAFTGARQRWDTRDFLPDKKTKSLLISTTTRHGVLL